MSKKGKKMVGKIRQFLWKWIMFFLNPRLLLCVALGWMITNGWSYLFVAIGTAAKIRWMVMVGTAYMGFLWFPFTPEKIITVLLAILFMRFFFPKDEKTVKVLRDKLTELKNAFLKKYGKKNKNTSSENAQEKTAPATQSFDGDLPTSDELSQDNKNFTDGVTSMDNILAADGAASMEGEALLNDEERDAEGEKGVPAGMTCKPKE